MLLWLLCVRMRHDMSATDSEKAQFGIAAWHEVDALEKSLNAHTCGLERSFLFQGREYLFKFVCFCNSALFCKIDMSTVHA